MVGPSLPKISPKWGSTSVYAIFCLFFVTVTFCHAGNGDLSEVEVDMTAEDYEDVQKLRCHQCYHSVHGEACLTLGDFTKVSVQECLADEPYCMVERFMTDNELTTFTRKCARACQPGCETAGDTYKLEYCYSCCQKDFCNVGNTGSDTRPFPGVLLFPSLLVSILTLLSSRFV